MSEWRSVSTSGKLKTKPTEIIAATIPKLMKIQKHGHRAGRLRTYFSGTSQTKDIARSLQGRLSRCRKLLVFPSCFLLDLVFPLGLRLPLLFRGDEFTLPAGEEPLSPLDDDIGDPLPELLLGERLGPGFPLPFGRGDFGGESEAAAFFLVGCEFDRADRKKLPTLVFFFSRGSWTCVNGGGRGRASDKGSSALESSKLKLSWTGLVP
mmetsp:Transcript_148128/g.269122  ORF Transcript_148128/g.269122 Transcript_148128/m.269122 type:complete len:208 (-) Transcript_148128:484-1107(-)